MALGKVPLTLLSVEFQVFGKVQGVYFRKETRKFCQENRIVGWVKNTPQGTVVGVAQGEVESIKKIKHWLTNVGSPRSQIERCEFSAERSIDKTEFEAFTIVKKM